MRALNVANLCGQLRLSSVMFLIKGIRHIHSNCFMYSSDLADYSFEKPVGNRAPIVGIIIFFLNKIELKRSQILCTYFKI